MLKHSKIMLLSGVIFLIIILIIFSPFMFGKINNIDLSCQLKPPCLKHIFGTDNFGRDLFQRTITGLKLSLGLAVAIQAISVFAGLIIGLLSGYYENFISELFIHLMNGLMSFPSMIAAFCIVALLGPGIGTIVIAISVLEWVTYARIIRSEVLSVRQMDFVQGVIALGGSNSHILLRHILPNVLMPVIPLVTLMTGHAVLTIAGLSFLGFGVQPPVPEIGLMLKEAIPYIDKAPWIMAFPGLMLALCVLLLNLLGDELRDKFDPKKNISYF